MKSSAISFKLYFKSGDIRRISTESTPTWAKFLDTLEELYPKTFHRELRIQYVDEEGDRITVSSDAEWKYALSTVIEGKPFKLYVEDGRHKGAYFKDGPAPVPVAFYEKKKDTKKIIPKRASSSTPLKKLQAGVPACLRALFKNGKILPYNMPEYLRGALTIRPLGKNEVDIDVNIFELYDTLHKYSMKCLESKDRAVLSEGLRVLQAMRFLGESNHITAYNEACAHALLGNKKEALTALQRSVKNGYKNVRHMEKDSDFASIRDTPEFKAILVSLKPKGPSIPLTKLKPVCKPVVVADSKWALHLQKLTSMGFTNEKLNISLLNKFNGNLQRVISHLL